MIISRTPFRISFFGGGTDYPAWYPRARRRRAGDHHRQVLLPHLPLPAAVLRAPLPRRLLEDREPPDDRRDRAPRRPRDAALPEHRRAASRSTTTATCRPAAAWAPARRSPSACSTPCTRCAARWPTHEQLARESIHLEQDVLQETVGSQDQVMAAYGGLNHIEFPPSGEIAVRPLTICRRSACRRCPST